MLHNCGYLDWDGMGWFAGRGEVKVRTGKLQLMHGWLRPRQRPCNANMSHDRESPLSGHEVSQNCISNNVLVQASQNYISNNFLRFKSRKTIFPTMFCGSNLAKLYFRQCLLLLNRFIHVGLHEKPYN